MTRTLTEKCPIWKTPASLDSSDLRQDMYWFFSPRVGGKYKVVGTIRRQLHDISSAQKVALTNWLWQQRKNGEEWPLLDFDLDNLNSQNVVKSVVERMDSAVIWFGEKLKEPGERVYLHSPGTGVQFESEHGILYAEFLAATSSIEDASGLLQLLLQTSLVDDRATQRHYCLTAQGWKKFSELQQNVTSSGRAFVAMWFSKTMDDAYNNGFEPAIRDAGYEPLRIDRKEHNNKIDDEIVAEIRRSRFVVADFTSEIVERKTKDGLEFIDTHARGGVYFEAGFAKGLGKQVIWCVQEDVINANVLHFDTRQFAHIVWKDAADLRQQLSRRISATLGDGPAKKTD